MKRIPLHLLFLLLFINISFAQKDVRMYSLKESIAYSLEHHPNSTIYKNEIEMAKQKQKEALSPYKPRVLATIGWDDNLINQPSVLPAGAFGSTTKQVIRFGVKYSMNANIQIDQVIYDHSIIFATKALKISQIVANNNLIKNNQEIVFNTIIAYYKVLTLNEQEKLLIENQKKTEELLKVMELQYQKGILKQIDYNRMLVTFNNIKSRLVVLQNSKEVALNQLKFAMGINLKDDLNIIDNIDQSKDIVMPAITDFSADKLIDYKIQQDLIKIKEIEVAQAKAAFYPVLTGYLRYSNFSFGTNLGESFTEWYAKDAQGNNQWFNSSAFGIKLSIPLFEGFRKTSKLSQTKLSLANARSGLKLAVMNYELQHKNAYTKLLNSYNNFNNNKMNLDLANEILSNYTLQYNVGASALSDFLNSDYAHKEAQSNYINSLIDFLSARAEYEKACGNLFEFINQLN